MSQAQNYDVSDETADEYPQASQSGVADPADAGGFDAGDQPAAQDPEPELAAAVEPVVEPEAAPEVAEPEAAEEVAPEESATEELAPDEDAPEQSAPDEDAAPEEAAAEDEPESRL